MSAYRPRAGGFASLGGNNRISEKRARILHLSRYTATGGSIDSWVGKSRQSS